MLTCSLLSDLRVLFHPQFASLRTAGPGDGSAPEAGQQAALQAQAKKDVSAALHSMIGAGLKDEQKDVHQVGGYKHQYTDTSEDELPIYQYSTIFHNIAIDQYTTLPIQPYTNTQRYKYVN